MILLLLGINSILIYFSINLINRVFSPMKNYAQEVTTFNIPEAQKIKHLQYIWTTPQP
jgi:hypothetical protein